MSKGFTRKSQNTRNEINKRIRAQIQERRELVFNSKGDSSQNDNIKIMYNEITQRAKSIRDPRSNEFFSIYTKDNTKKFRSMRTNQVGFISRRAGTRAPPTWSSRRSWTRSACSASPSESGSPFLRGRFRSMWASSTPAFRSRSPKIGTKPGPRI